MKIGDPPDITVRRPCILPHCLGLVLSANTPFAFACPHSRLHLCRLSFTVTSCLFVTDMEILSLLVLRQNLANVDLTDLKLAM